MEAAGDHILICDADLSTPIEELDGFWRYIKVGYDIVIASRPLRESHLVKHQPFHREFAGRTFNFLVRAIAVRGIHDTQCGFKLFCRDAAEAIFPRCSLDGFSFDIEVLHIAQRLGYTIKEAPVHWYHRPGSKVSLLRDGPRMLTDLIKLRLRRHDLRKQTCDETR
jgi:dolichyl-phosphate beta-glucosyltransferase